MPKKAKNLMYFTENQILGYKIVFSAFAGVCIGEKALETSQKRAATCYASHDSVILTMDRRSFMDFFENAKQDDSSKFMFLEEYFAKLPPQKMKNFSYLFELNEYDRGQIVFKEGDDSDTIYFIEEGQVELYRKPKQK